MAELTGTAPLADARQRDLPVAAQQLRAIAWLRWRILANNFRRQGGAGELIARIFILPLFAAVALVPTAGAGFGAWYIAREGQLGKLVWILWAIFALSQFLNINLGQPGTTFDPVELIRFPMPLRRFVLVRLCFGLLSPANAMVGLLSAAVVIGLTIVHPQLFLAALVAVGIFALTNVLFTRMVFAWVDRWLSTRRARELFTGLIFAASLVFQYLNVNYNPAFQHGRTRGALAQKLHWIAPTAQGAQPFLAWLPPELTTAAIQAGHHGAVGPFLTTTASCALFAALFLAVYVARMRTEFRGENLSDLAAAPLRPSRPLAPLQHTPALPQPLAPATPATAATNRFLPSSLAPLLGKELLILRRNIGLFYGLIAPAVMVFLFAGRLSIRHGSHWVLLAATAYALLGISPMGYNSFGFEGTGAQLYFLAPVPLREVFFAKNVFLWLLALAEVAVVLAVVGFVAGRPTPVDAAFIVLWSVGTLSLNTWLGNLRSVAAPKRVNPGRTLNKAQSSLSAFIAFGVLGGCAALGFGCQFLAAYLDRPWLGLLLMTLFAGAGLGAYFRGLRRIETYALDRRDQLFEELGRKA